MGSVGICDGFGSRGLGVGAEKDACTPVGVGVKPFHKDRADLIQPMRTP
jgi:hypothetical protein